KVKAKEISVIYGIIPDHCVQVHLHVRHSFSGCKSPESYKTRLSDWIPIYAPLQIGVIEPIEVIIHPAVDVDQFAGEAIDVAVGQSAAAADLYAERTVPVTGDHRLIGIQHVRDIPASVGEIEIIRGPVPGRVAVRAAQ